ncbi:hypothetical protein EIN_521680 [Entamoeba invadens IP1]|uniref:CXXC-rich protein n=1 Tax=Entamoeba invadens IP1 TaxID=370355 RepID=A0A0A1U9Q5_ENTIV|nr:hypothetical protein EIN_521680 [Entamoeba invadens IP1]ELP91741.1 hypothetical protein EIN_521680 [Entamoeba invadens IP1]|eukprot:XP_004258512.1 hypothetical protein EIN_521680 [Entamoeba invadens IP1]
MIITLSLLFAYFVSRNSLDYCVNHEIENNTCSKCVDNYILDKDGYCDHKLDLHYSFDSTITNPKCADGYKFNFADNTCIMGVEICRKFYINNNNPDASSFHYYCDSCYNDFTVMKKTQKCFDCSRENKGCLEADENCAKCSECNVGFYLEQGKCVQLPNCETYFNSTSCKHCIHGYYPDNGTCVRGGMDNCLIYISQSECDTCGTEYLSLEGECHHMPYCEYLNDKKEECEKCKDGYGKLMTDCEKCMENCELCGSNQTMCEQCKIGYWYNSGKCSKCITNCDKCSKDDTCDKCSMGSSYMEGTTNKCDTNRVEHCMIGKPNDVNVCQECESNYFLSVDKNKCISCEKNLCSNLDSSACKMCSNNCETVDSDESKCASKSACKSTNNGKCLGCIEGFFLTADFRCEGCSKECEGMCYNNASSCIVEKEEGCAEADVNHVCITCKVGYVFDDKKCVDASKDRVCQVYDSDKKCTVCQVRDPNNTDNDKFVYPVWNNTCELDKDDSINSNNGESFIIVTTLLALYLLL